VHEARAKQVVFQHVDQELAAVRGRALRLTVVGWAEPGEVYVHGPGISVIGLRARDLVAPRGAFARAVSEADLVIDIGAGDGFADIYGAKRIAMNLAAKSMVLALGRPLILAPQTIGPFRRAWARDCARARHGDAGCPFRRGAARDGL